VVERVDVLNFVLKLYRKIYSQGYVRLVERAPELYALLFKKTDNPKLLQKWLRVRRGFTRRTTRKFIAHLKEFQPDAVVCPHFLPLEVLGCVKTRGFNPLTVCIVTDFEAHALWMDSSVDLYCVAAEETKARLVARGVSEENIFVSGIPVAEKFSAPLDKAAILKHLGLRDDLPTLLGAQRRFWHGAAGRNLARTRQAGAACSNSGRDRPQ